jgi:cytochrome bd-I ubiquinol oxidase subunit X
MRGSARNLHEEGAKAMWYFSWILGIGVALGFGIINVMWLDANGKFLNGHGPGQSGPENPGSEKADTHQGEARRP